MKKKIIYLFISIVLVIIILASTTYSVLFKVDSTDEQSYTTGMLNITSNAINNSVTLTNGLPISDTEGKTSTPYTFKISNVGNLKYKFDVKILSTNTNTTTMINPEYIKIMVDNNEPVKLSTLTDGIILSNKTLSPGENIEVTIRMWLDEYTSNTEIGKTFTAKITTTGQAIYEDTAIAKLDNSGANSPVLVDGMIPVVYSADLKKWVKAETSKTTETATCTALGDVVTSDGANGINPADFQFLGGYVNNYMFGNYALNASQRVCADVDGDGYITNKDVTLIQEYYSGKITTFPKGEPLSTVTGTVQSNLLWYNYDSNKWANAVLVSSTNRSTYQNAPAGIEIADSDILAFYVWIPRFKYKVWNINKVIGTDSYNAQTTGIDIVFEDGISSTGTVKCTAYDYLHFSSTEGDTSETCTGSNGEYYTHPAFTFGTDELDGFWMGKFELSSETPTATKGGGDSTTLTPRILPNVNSWRSNYLTNFWKVIYDMQKEDNIYGLPTSRIKADSHLITNLGWGAVAYLTNSKYGRCSSGTCTELSINNCDSFVTGIGAANASAASSSTTCTGTSYKYTASNGTKASTTSNVYGVYDMNGGSAEYVMSLIVGTDGSISDMADIGSNFTYNTANEKYILLYSYAEGAGGKQRDFNISRLGDALGETSSSERANWYSDGAFFPDYVSQVFSFTRGGLYSRNVTSGIFSVIGNTGSAVTGISARAIITAQR